MTATEDLRRLLDERGVEYETDDVSDSWYEKTTWRSENNLWWTYEVSAIEELPYGTLTLLDTGSNNSMMPAQAIAATLGTEPDDAAMVELHEQMNAALHECEEGLGIRMDDENAVVVVPFVARVHSLLEEAATLGGTDATSTRRGGETFQRVYLVETSDDLLESWYPFAVYLHREAAEDCAEALRTESDGVRSFAKVSELKVASE